MTSSYKAFAVAATVAFASIGGAAHAQFAKSDSEIMTPASMGTIKNAPVGTPLTRAQVIAEREQARRDGTLVVDYVTGKPLVTNAAKVDAPAVAAKTRAEVRAEIEQARRDNTLVVSEITGKPFYGSAHNAAARNAGAE